MIIREWNLRIINSINLMSKYVCYNHDKITKKVTMTNFTGYFDKKF